MKDDEIVKKIIVRADDLGYCEAVNYGIRKAIKEGIINNVGLMPNMETADQGWMIVKEFNPCAGLHANISVGSPLSDPKLIKSICQKNGEFKNSSQYRISETDLVNLDEVIIEIEAQLKRFIEITGRKPSYFEGHAVASENFQKGLQIVAERNNCDYLKLDVTQPVKFRNVKVLACFDSLVQNQDPLDAVINRLETSNNNDILMFIFHPGYVDDFLLKTSSLSIPRTSDLNVCTNSKLKKYLNDRNIKCLRYDEL